MTPTDDLEPGIVYTPAYAHLDQMVNRITAARKVIAQFVYANSPMTPQQKAAWAEWLDSHV